MNFSETLALRKTKIENFLDESINLKGNLQKEIYEAMRYSLLNGGKRIRGILALSGGLLAGAKEKDILPVACGMEMIHAYSLVHDDLPAMDDDDMRRGKPSCHKKYGEAMGILTGDALLNGAMELMLTASVPSCSLVDALKLIFTASGADGMIGGQVVDTLCCTDNLDDLIYLHSRKTVALIAASLLGGYTAGSGKDENTFDILKNYSVKIGLAFQVIDDILDVEGNEQLLGKPIGSDERNNKQTFVFYKGVSGAKDYALSLSRKAAEIVKPLGPEGEFLSQLATYLTERKF